MKFISHVFALFLGLLSAVYLINPTAGVIELIPDNIPGAGNLDEAAATALLMSCLAYFGIDLTRFARRKVERKPDANLRDPRSGR